MANLDCTCRCTCNIKIQFYIQLNSAYLSLRFIKLILWNIIPAGFFDNEIQIMTALFYPLSKHTCKCQGGEKYIQ